MSRQTATPTVAKSPILRSSFDTSRKRGPAPAACESPPGVRPAASAVVNGPSKELACANGALTARAQRHEFGIGGDHHRADITCRIGMGQRAAEVPQLRTMGSAICGAAAATAGACSCRSRVCELCVASAGADQKVGAVDPHIIHVWSRPMSIST